MEKISTQAKWQPWKGVIFQIVAVGMLLFPGSLIQYCLGLWGVVITELMFLALAIIWTLAKKTPLKEVFPVKVPTVRDVIGTVMLWFGVMPLSILSVLIMMMLIPEGFVDTASGLNEVLSSESAVLTFIAAAVLPPVCEEALQRGVALSYFRSLKHDWVIVLIIGIFFGILHLDPVRFGTTAILGAALAYVVVKRNNMVLAFIIHFINNAYSVGMSLISDTTEQVETAEVTDAVQTITDSGLMVIGAFLIIGCLSPMLIAGAIHLLNPGKKLHNFRRYIIAGVLSGLMFFSGLVMFVATMIDSPEYQEIYESIEAEQMEQLEQLE
ncbi:MAG: CPBP family intramembrane metalloprotease [Clostridiales bacterium]|nr:CPBP family intramembrane metalloprotease [Clostridiales bacterium]